MVLLIHGDDITASRNYFLEERQKDTNSLTLEGEKLTITDLAQTVEGGDLFSTNKKSIYIEQLLTKRKKSKELEEITNFIQKYSKDNDYVLWEAKELERSHLNYFKNPVVKIFKLPQSLFLFLDTIKPANGKQNVQLFHNSITTSEPELVFFMLVKRIRLLLALSSEKKPAIDEVKRLSDWQRSKLQKQVQFFDKNTLVNLYTRLFELEYKQKTGNLPVPLSDAIDFLLIAI